MEESKRKTGLFFGSFNPIHIGHLIIANHFLEYSDIYQLWFVVSPHNPLKRKQSLLADHHRLSMVKIAIDGNPKMRACDIEFNLSQPSYTIDTLTYMQEKYPKKQFVLIMGADNLVSFDKWKNPKQILDQYELYVYPRPATKEGRYKDHPKVRRVDAPIMEISSSFIRKALKEKKKMPYMLPQKVYEYILEMHFYEMHFNS